MIKFVSDLPQVGGFLRVHANHMLYAYLEICLTRQDNTLTIETTFLYSGCDQEVSKALDIRSRDGCFRVSKE